MGRPALFCPIPIPVWPGFKTIIQAQTARFKIFVKALDFLPWAEPGTYFNWLFWRLGTNYHPLSLLVIKVYVNILWKSVTHFKVFTQWGSRWSRVLARTVQIRGRPDLWPFYTVAAHSPHPVFSRMPPKIFTIAPKQMRDIAAQ